MGVNIVTLKSVGEEMCVVEIEAKRQVKPGENSEGSGQRWTYDRTYWPIRFQG